MPTKAKKTDTPEEEFGAKFARLRRRAQDADTKLPKVGDFILSPEDGFDPPVIAKFPLSMKRQEQLYYAARTGDIFAQMRLLLGDDQYERVRDMFDTVEDGQDLMIGLTNLLLDHAAGRGADDVPGGS